MVIGLKSNSNALGSHTKNNCLLMVSITMPLQSLKADGKSINKTVPCNTFFEEFWLFPVNASGFTPPVDDWLLK